MMRKGSELDSVFLIIDVFPPLLEKESSNFSLTASNLPFNYLLRYGGTLSARRGDFYPDPKINYSHF